jgi:hypothetical protein
MPADEQYVEKLCNALWDFLKDDKNPTIKAVALKWGISDKSLSKYIKAVEGKGFTYKNDVKNFLKDIINGRPPYLNEESKVS